MKKILLIKFVLILSINFVYAQPANDNYAGAINVTGIINSCSADAAYTTLGATPDVNSASCWNTGPDYNVWFQFTAPASGAISVTVDRGGIKGTIRRVNVAIWESDGTTEVACNRYIGENDDVVVQSPTLTPGATYYISVDNNDASRRGTFTLCLDEPVSLPIQLVYFNAIVENERTVKLEWVTASEMNNDFFTVERSLNAFDWEIVTTINGAGNSSTTLTYSTVDNNPYNYVSYYRLKQTDFDGQFEYANIKSVNLKATGSNNVQIYPNPTNNFITLQGNSEELAEIKIINALGQEVTNLISITNKNASTVIIDLSNLSQGVYYVKTKTTANSVYKK